MPTRVAASGKELIQMSQFKTPSLNVGHRRKRQGHLYKLSGAARGQVLVLATMLIVVLVGMVALATDLGILWSERRQMQSATDAAAIAAVSALRSSGSVTSAARNVASLNGFTNGANNTTVTVNNPPAAGPNSGNANYVEVLITEAEPTYFLRVLGHSSMNVSTRAVSGIINSAGCIYALDPSAAKAISASNGVNISSSCGIFDDSNNSDALDVVGGAVVKATGVGVVGQAVINNGGAVENTSGGSLTISQNIAPVPDPLAHITAPSVGSCTYSGTQNYNAYTAQQSPPYSGKYVINPGVYCGGISVSNGVSVTFNSGTYILAGGGMSLQAGGGTVSGSAVSFYVTTGAKAGYSGSNSAYGGITMANGATVSFSAPTTGGTNSLEGILFYQDRSVATGSAASAFAGGANLTLNGALYFPTTTLNYSNGINASYTILVADTLVFTGGATMNNNYASLADGSPIQSSSLFE
jgi:Flp pilus assembly protein TadG